MSHRRFKALIFDFDGTLVDSDEALVQPFLRLGVPRESITFGHAVKVETDRLGLSLEDYVNAYDVEVVQPFAGVQDVIGRLGRWAICSNKHPMSASAELSRLGWSPELSVFSDHFGWEHKVLDPVLEALELPASDVAMIGDSGGDQHCAELAGVQMIWAGWNPRVRRAQPEGWVLAHPSELLDLYD